MSFTFIENTATDIEIPQSGMTKRILLQEPHVRAIGFGFAAGTELKEHTAPVDVVLQFLEGEADVSLGGEQKAVRAGSMIHISRGLPHSVRAATPVKMLLLMLLSG